MGTVMSSRRRFLQGSLALTGLGLLTGCGLPPLSWQQPPKVPRIGYLWNGPVSPIFEEYVASFGLADRLRCYPGDFFVDPLPHVDVLIMGHVLHDWSDDEKRTLIAKAHAALPDGGALIVYEALIDDDRSQQSFGLLMSLNMMIETPAGRDYTGAECCAWMREAGFRETRVEHLVGPDSMVIGVK